MLINCLPHDVNIYVGCNFDGKIRKFRGGKLAATIPASGHLVNVDYTTTVLDPICVDGVEIPVEHKFISAIDSLPENSGDIDGYIVSALYAAARKELGMDMSKVYTIGGAVVADDNRTVLGCTGLICNLQL